MRTELPGDRNGDPESIAACPLPILPWDVRATCFPLTHTLQVSRLDRYSLLTQEHYAHAAR